MTLDNRKVKKNSHVIRLEGGIDELNSFIGFAKVPFKNNNYSSLVNIYELLENIQNLLLQLGASVSAPNDTCYFIKDEQIHKLEESIDYFMNDIKLNSFVIYGDNEASARIDLARTVCRRIETMFYDVDSVNENSTRYINRLSDFLFALGRFVDSQSSNL